MRNYKKKYQRCPGSQQSSQQGANAGNRFEAQIVRLMEATNTKNESELARVLGIRQQSVAGARIRKQLPPGWITRISEQFGVSSDWLWFGKGTMRRHEAKVGEARGEYQQQKASPEIPVSHGLDAEHFDLVPVVETYLNAGAGAFVLSEMVCGYCAFRKDWLNRTTSSPRNAVLVPIRGPSMEPNIQGGDMVMIDTGRVRIYDGCIYAIGIGETISIKRLYPLSNGRIRTVSDNPKYPTEEVLPEELRVIGQVIWFARELIK